MGAKGPKPQRVKFGPSLLRALGNEAGEQIRDVKMVGNAVLKAHGIRPGRTASGGLSVEKQVHIAAIDLHFHDLRHEAGSRKLEAGRPLHAVSAFLGHANVTTTARYLNVKDDYLQELIERKPLALAKV